MVKVGTHEHFTSRNDLLISSLIEEKMFSFLIHFPFLNCRDIFHEISNSMLQHICVLASVDDIWLRTAKEFTSSMEAAGIQNIVLQYIFPKDVTASTNGSASADNRIKDILGGLHDLARSMNCYLHGIFDCTQI